jgi:hypothetical protein
MNLFYLFKLISYQLFSYQLFSFMYQRNFAKFILICLLFSTFGCQKSGVQPATVSPATLRDVPALKLNFRFETDVPAPPATNETAQSDERNAAVHSRILIRTGRRNFSIKQSFRQTNREFWWFITGRKICREIFVSICIRQRGNYCGE